MRASLAACVVAVLVIFSACSSPDPRLETPQTTVETLLKANHLWGLTSLRLSTTSTLEAIRPQIDIETVALCFWDFDRDDPAVRAQADFVAGMIAAGQSQMVYHIGRDRAVARSIHRDIHFTKAPEGWLIVLRDTVPDEVRERLRTGPSQKGGLRSPDEVL